MQDAPINLQGDIPEFHRLMGKAIRAWALVEDQMWLFVATLLGVDQFRARIIISSMPGARAKRDLVSRLAETYLDPVLLPQFRPLLKRMKRLGRTRNLLAHSRMHINVDGRKNLAFSDAFSKEFDGGLDFKARPIPLKELKDLVVALENLQRDLVHFLPKCAGHVFNKAKVHREESAKQRAEGQST